MYRTYPENYKVRFRYKKPDGFYTTECENVEINIGPNDPEKCNHDRAVNIIKARRYDDFELIYVKYND